MAPAPTYRLVRSAVPPRPDPVLDAGQREVLAHGSGPLRVLAGPGTGKTTTLVEAVVDRVENRGVPAEKVLVLTFSRRAAAALRSRICARLGRTTREPVAMTFHSYAFALLRADAVLRGEPAPRLLTGPEQDLIVRDLLTGDLDLAARGRGTVRWPDSLRSALNTRGFAVQLRDLLLRATERGLSPADLAALGRETGHPEWEAAGAFLDEYRHVTALRSPVPAYDPAELVAAATGLLAGDDRLLAAERGRRDVVFVDEYQDADPAQERLLLQLAGGGGRDLVVVGDPDQSIYGFRGSDPEVLTRFPDRFPTSGGDPAPTVALTVSRRLPTRLLAASRRVAVRLGGPVAHRALSPADEAPEGRVVVSTHPTHTQEAASVAATLRRAHLVDGVAWKDMAVLVRASSQLGVLRRALQAADVPVSVEVSQVPFTDEPAVRPLLLGLQVVLGDDLNDDTAVELVTSMIGGADAWALRRLRRQLGRGDAVNAAENADASGQDAAIAATGDILGMGPTLRACLRDPGMLDEVTPKALTVPVRRIADMLAAGESAAAEQGATAETVLWAMWQACGVSPRWAASAVEGGPAAAEHDRALDAVLALFDAVAGFVDRLPAAGPRVFLDHVLGQQFPADSLGSSAPDDDTVALLTAHASKGLEWEVVAVAGVDEGVWPSLRTSGSVLGSDTLTQHLSGLAGTPGAVVSARLAEERRLFYVAVTRARREVHVSAVANDDTAPSRFLADLSPDEPVAGRDPLGSGADLPSAEHTSLAPRSLDASSLTAHLRSVVCDEARGDDERREAARQLARLARAGIVGADPGHWYGLPALSGQQPVVPDGVRPTVSPSRVESLLECALRSVLEKSLGATRPSTSSAVGSLVHALADEVAREVLDVADLPAELDRRWPQIDAGTGWVARRERQRAEGIVRRLQRYLESRPAGAWARSELDFIVELDPVVVKGRVDRLERDPSGGLLVVDFKTGQSAPSSEKVKVHPQLTVYQAAVEGGAFEAKAETRTSAGAVLIQLGKESADPDRWGTSRQPALADEPDDAGRERARTYLREAAAAMTGPVFTATVNSRCRICAVRSSCPLQPTGKQVTP